MKLGVFGGTFDPIHLGHLHVARLVKRLFGLSHVQFVVSTSPPHKQGQDLLPLCHRYAMVALATATTPQFLPSLVELQPPASPFSIHTLRKLARRVRGGRLSLYFIAGTDSLMDIPNWRASDELLTSYNFIFVSRPGLKSADPASALPRKASSRLLDLRGMGPMKVRSLIRSERKPAENKIYLIDIGALDISSSRIRQRIREGKRVRHLVPPNVHSYISKLSLYGER